jgi:hypothetical protein
MPLTTVRFTRVFDRVDNMTRNGTLTVFSFESDGGTQYGVQVPGHPAIEPGMRVLAYLDKPGRWDTLVGWRNLDTGELAIESRASYWPMLLMGAVMAAFVTSQRGMPQWICLAIAVFLLLPLAELLKIHRARRALVEP